MPVTCEHLDDRLSPLRDDELGGLDGWQLQAHLRHCPRCAAAAVESADVDDRLRAGLAGAPPPDYLTAAIMHRLPAMPPARSRGSLVRRRWRSLGWVVGAGCAALQATALWGAFRVGYVAGQVGRAAPVVSSLSAAAAPAAPETTETRARRGGTGGGRAQHAARPAAPRAPLAGRGTPAFVFPPVSPAARREAAVAAQAAR